MGEPVTVTGALRDRARGVLLASAVGDALGAGYEFGSAPLAPGEAPAMIGGGLGGFAPGEWTDDTAQAVPIAQALAAGLDPRSRAGLDVIAAGFATWFAGNPPDVGIQTREVLALAGARPDAAALRAAAFAVHERRGRSAGNGALMRTGPLALGFLDDPAGLVAAALGVAGLTHHERDAGESAALWCLLIRHAVRTGELATFDDVAPWLPNAERWRGLLAQAEARPPGAFTPNTWTVTALQAAWSAIRHTPGRGVADSLATAIHIGDDTDTVAAIAGALVGGLHGASAVPGEWRAIVHGWPGLTGDDLVGLADAILEN